MKKLIIWILIPFCFWCCVSEDSKNYDYSIFNNSGVTVVIVPYGTDGMRDLSKKVVLSNNEKISLKRFVYYPAPHFLDMAEVITRDRNISLTKIEFIFNLSKKTLYSNCKFTSTGVEGCTESRNIFRSEFNDEETEVYTITPEDYQNAQDCSGNCN
ncbi:hypothetical protein DNC80_04965 [Flavobacterium sp. SOK18b]|uniref:hypothetical protein n=1 Tax=Flavobacterium sp. SOK18b TaxID=797900 RepID=UPI0015F8D05B|nr:hypothetical protein [Flavobacterium sp. SOK18b]MBB1193019.1 hypothetical protein [Flavobacterium sp. SOK18b]